MEGNRVAIETLPWGYDELVAITVLLLTNMALIWTAWRIQNLLKRTSR